MGSLPGIYLYSQLGFTAFQLHLHHDMDHTSPKKKTRSTNNKDEYTAKVDLEDGGYLY